ncbi:calcium homeostasis modulator protein 6-like [Montipora foliosa]|uniref:calcium homeostasis modulator protein 6-like n=1 Tax=Montipora foliosa TaxID=591990 RepID=UPI0035F153CC
MGSEQYAEILRTVEVPVKTSLITLVLYGLKVFLQQIVFSCPSDHHVIYASLFICGPAVILFCLSMLISESFWTLVTGCCRLKTRTRRLVWWRSRKSVFLSFLPPYLWVIFAFMEGDFYACLILGPLRVAKLKAANSTALIAVQEQYISAKSVSAIISWMMAIVLTVSVTVAVTLTRLLAKVDPKLKGEIEFDEIEAQEAAKLWNARLSFLAKAQASKVMEKVDKISQDSDVVEQVKRGEAYLCELYPKFGGVVSGHFRDYNWIPEGVHLTDEQEDFSDRRTTSVNQLLINSKKVKDYGVRHTTSL